MVLPTSEPVSGFCTICRQRWSYHFHLLFYPLVWRKNLCLKSCGFECWLHHLTGYENLGKFASLGWFHHLWNRHNGRKKMMWSSMTPIPWVHLRLCTYNLPPRQGSPWAPWDVAGNFCNGTLSKTDTCIFVKRIKMLDINIRPLIICPSQG